MGYLITTTTNSVTKPKHLHGPIEEFLVGSSSHSADYDSLHLRIALKLAAAVQLAGSSCTDLRSAA